MKKLQLPVLLFLFFLAAGFSLHDSSPPSADQPFPSIPEWAKHAVWYQIFPERFRNGDTRNDPTAEDVKIAWPFDVPAGWQVSPWTSDWYKLEPWETRRGGRFYENTAGRRYGGDLQGVIDKLDYLKQLGISAIISIPSSSPRPTTSNDAALYHHIVKNFGPDPAGDRAIWSQENPDDPATWKWTAADKLFLELLAQAHRRGIKVVIDGVFNHVGRSFWAFKSPAVAELHDFRVRGSLTCRRSDRTGRASRPTVRHATRPAVRR